MKNIRSNLFSANRFKAFLRHFSLNIGFLFLLPALFFTGFVNGQTIKVDVDHPQAKIQPTMWGLFFEDINFAADGGLYAELIKNRSFEFPNPKTGWEFPGQNFFNSSILFVNRGAENENVRFARMKLDGTSSPQMVNTGFRGIGLKEREQYRFSVWASVATDSEMQLKIEVLDSNDQPLGVAIVEPEGTDWQKYEAVLTAGKTEAKGKLRITFEGKGSIDFDVVSLFPVNTWKNRENGLRADLVQLLADMKPGFFRFPGGCIVEGRDLEKRYQWKQTIGNIEDRKLNINRWNDENTRLTPDYFQSYGLGFYEYFLLCEDIGAEPIPVVNCGMACQFNTAEVVPLEDLDPYIQDALDLIEFANGPADSKWGKIRADMGHPEPFGMEYIGIGNEQWGMQYFERYELFENAILERSPEMKIISTTGPMASGPFFDVAERELKKYHAALVDEHYYNRPEWFLQNANRYDDYNRDTYKIFVGEYAAASKQMASPENKNTWECALAEAAFMTGLERNADVVTMASYAPLLAHVDAWQWTPDLIWFDNLKSYGTPSYYVQKMYSTSKGTVVLPVSDMGEPLTGQDGLYASASMDEESGEIFVKVVNTAPSEKNISLDLNSKSKFSETAKIEKIGTTDLEALNTIENPVNVTPKQENLPFSGKKLEVTLQANTFYVIKLKIN